MSSLVRAFTITSNILTLPPQQFVVLILTVGVIIVIVIVAFHCVLHKRHVLAQVERLQQRLDGTLDGEGTGAASPSKASEL